MEPIKKQHRLGKNCVPIVSLKQTNKSNICNHIDDVMMIMNLSFESKYGEAWNTEQLKSMLNMPYISMLIAYTENNDAIGFAVTRTITDETEIMLIAVIPEYQNNSVGSKILDWIISVSKDSGVKKIFLEVRSNNQALYFYKKYSFFQIGIRRNYYKGNENNRYDALTLLKKL